MFCINCGKEIKENTKFCIYCGSPVQPISSSVPPSPETVVPPIPKKAVSPFLIGGISAAVLANAIVAGSVFYFTSRHNADTEKTSVSAEKKEKAKDTKKKDPAISDTDTIDTEEESPAIPKTTQLLQDYLETELIPQYGTANLGVQTKEFAYENLYDEANAFWTNSVGLSDAKIYDLDQDGEEELLVFLLTEENITLHIYEAEGDDVRQAVSYNMQNRYSDMDGFDFSCSLLNVDGTPYLFYHEEGYGIISDFSITNASLYRYDSGQFYSPLTIAQTAGGSSEFVYTAYQYNAEGELLGEEIVYDEISQYESDCSPDHYYQRVTELFNEYGISLDSDASIEEGQDIYHDIAKADGYEILLHLEMEGEYFYQDDLNSYVYHFNDFDSPWASYRRFLSQEETVRMKKDAWYNGHLQEEWTLKDIREVIADEHETFPRIEYAYLDCGNDGIEELAVRFVGLNIYDQGDDSDLTMIITCKDSSLEVVYSCESWARSYTSPLYHGCIPSGGSNGAGDHPFDLHYLDANGDLHTVYEARQLGGMWFRDIDADIYDTVFDSDPAADVTRYQIDGKDYCVMHSYDTDIDSLCQEYVSLCEQKGMHFVSDDEINELIEQYAQELGIEYDWMFEEELSWMSWY